MAQSTNTKHSNELHQNALSSYQSSRERIKNIEKKVRDGQKVEDEEILWLCRETEDWINHSELSWFDN